MIKRQSRNRQPINYPEEQQHSRLLLPKLSLRSSPLLTTRRFAPRSSLPQYATFHANFERRRAVERKHGRVAMAAVVGMLFHNAGIEFPGYLSKSENMRFSDVPDGFTGLFSIPTAGLAQIFFFCGVCELAIWPASNYSGDYGTGYGRPFVPNVLEGDELKYKLDMEVRGGERSEPLGESAVGPVIDRYPMCNPVMTCNPSTRRLGAII